MSAVDLLTEPVRRWIWQQNWTALRDVQEKAIPAILAGGDVIVSARTAAGKTEAAILPLLTRYLSRADGDRDGFGIVIVSPLKALINDQYGRLQSLCETCDVALHRWHGDVQGSARREALERPSGVLLITPESLEAMLVRRPKEVAPAFRSAEAFVIDELHAFIGSERGIQLQSILSRIEIATGRARIDRIGLSATLGDMQLASAALRPRAQTAATLVEGNDPGNGVKLQIRAYTMARGDEATRAISDRASAAEGAHADGDDAERSSAEDIDNEEDEPEEPLVPPAVAADLFRFLRGRSNLLFAGSRANVELYTDALRRLAEASKLPNEFFAHHGNLAKAEREAVETRLRDDPRPTTAVATTTLELGIDIGDVETIAQIGPGPSVAALRQRLGRSGRRAGQAAILRIFVVEKDPRPGDHPLDGLHLPLIQSIAMVELLAEGWCEPPTAQGLHLSTLVHQILAVIVQTGGAKPAALFQILCERGAFVTVDKSLFADLLREMASPAARLIEQSPDGLVMVGEQGERITQAHDFYAVFMTETEYRIIHAGRTLGTHSITMAIAEGQTLIFAGRRWLITAIDDDRRVIEVVPSRRGRPPSFSSAWGGIHDVVAHRMRRILTHDITPTYLDTYAREMLAAARKAFHGLGLDATAILPWGKGCLLLPWLGTKRMATLALALSSTTDAKTEASVEGLSIEMPKTTPEQARTLLAQLMQPPAVEPSRLASRIAKPQRAKFDIFLPQHLMALVAVVEQLDIASIQEAAALALAGDERR